MAYSDAEIRDHYNQAVQKIKTHDKRKRGCVTGAMVDRVKDLSGRMKNKIPLGEAVRVQISDRVIRRTHNNFDWSNMFGQKPTP